MKYSHQNVEPQNDDIFGSEENFELSKDVAWYHRVLLNNSFRVGLTLFLLAIVVPLLVFYFTVEKSYRKVALTDDYSFGSCSHDIMHRMQCGPVNISDEECSKHCCFDETTLQCYHRMPSRFSYIAQTERWKDYITTYLPRFFAMRDVSGTVMDRRQHYTPYNEIENIPQLHLKIVDYSKTHTKFILYDSKKINLTEDENIIEDKEFYHVLYSPEFYLEFFKNGTKRPLLSTVRGPLIAGENIWEWSFYLSDDHIYGLGELYLGQRIAKIFYNNEQDTINLPFVMGHRNGSFHAIYLEHQGTTVFNVSEDKVVNIKSFAGDVLAFHFFYGPRPGDIIKEFVKFTNGRDVPPYWAMGAHFCRGNSTLANFTDFVNNSMEAGLPYDSDCISDDIFKYLNFDMSANETTILSEAIDLLQSESRRFLPIIRPHVKYYEDETIDEKLMIKHPYDEESFKGLMFNETVVYPDFSKDGILNWLQSVWNFSQFSNSFVLKDSWPKNEAEAFDCRVDLPYVTERINVTLCSSIPWNARDFDNSSLHMNNHNKYGSDFAKAIIHEIELNTPSEKAFVLSSSSLLVDTFGFHIQNVTSSWQGMRRAFRRLVANSMAGVYVQSLPVCGDSPGLIGEELERMCLKWYIASTMLPIFYVHSTSVRKDPFAFSGFAQRMMIHAIEMRYTLLPHYYTVLNKGEPLLRAMYYEFYDNQTLINEDQYMVGDAMMIAPDFYDSKSTMRIYFPGESEWFDLWGGTRIPVEESGWMDIPTMESDIGMFLRSGFIIPIQESVFSTAMETRLNSNYTLLIAMSCSDINTGCIAKGALYTENSNFLYFNSDEKELLIENLTANKPHLCGATPSKVSSSIIDRVRIYGFSENINNHDTHFIMSDLNIDICELTTDTYKLNYA